MRFDFRALAGMVRQSRFVCRQVRANARQISRPRPVCMLAFAVICWGTTTMRAAEPDTALQAQGKNAPAEVSRPASQPSQTGRADTARLDGIRAETDEHGHTVYVNAPPPKLGKAPASVRRQSSVLVYWDRKEQRWKPVPPPTPAAMKAARNAAAEVASYFADGSRPGSVESQNRQGPAAGSSSEAPEPAVHYRYLAGTHQPSAQEIDAVIERAAARHKVDPNLVRAVIKVESNFNPWAVSKKGAMGLMQLMPETARKLNVTNPFDPQENVDAGVRHLRTLLDNFGGDVRLSLAAYNAGERAVVQHAGIPNFSETRNYVKQITSRYGAGSGGLMARPTAAPLRVFRDANGILTIRND